MPPLWPWPNGSRVRVLWSDAGDAVYRNGIILGTPAQSRVARVRVENGYLDGTPTEHNCDCALLHLLPPKDLDPLDLDQWLDHS